MNTIQPSKNKSFKESKNSITFKRDEQQIEEHNESKLCKEKENKNTHIPPNLKRRL